jgi:hypothetical protein
VVDSTADDEQRTLELKAAAGDVEAKRGRPPAWSPESTEVFGKRRSVPASLDKFYVSRGTRAVKADSAKVEVR